MHGQFRSVVDCPKCNYKSIQFDPFLVCSLPIVSITKKSIRLIFVKNHVQEIVLHLSSTINSHTCMSEIEKMAIVKLGLAGHVRLFFYVLSYGNCEVIHSTDLVEKVMLRYKGSNIYLRELMAHEDPQKDVKVILQNTICESEFGEKYRINIIPRRIYFFSNDTTTKQLHYRLYSYYKQHYEVGNYEQDIINVSAQEQPLRIMGLPSSYSDICKSCCQKNCQGCIFRFDDTKLGQFLQDKVELEIFWRMNAREIKERMQSQQGEQVGSGNTTKPKGT